MIELLKTLWYEVMPEDTRKTILLACSFFWAMTKMFLQIVAIFFTIGVVCTAAKYSIWTLFITFPVIIFALCLLSAKTQCKKCKK